MLLGPLFTVWIGNVLRRGVPASATGAALIFAVLFFIEMSETLGANLGWTVGVTEGRSR